MTKSLFVVLLVIILFVQALSLSKTKTSSAISKVKVVKTLTTSNLKSHKTDSKKHKNRTHDDTYAGMGVAVDES